METLIVVLAAFDPAVLVNILIVAVGLGLVIFFHELGHFAVAKWCDVQVERFSIGFGPVLFSRKWGETEYALSAIPFGGYVKMLGQDDVDPSQLTSEEIAQDPRSYTAKSVPQRMAIISAGVTMNIITGLLFFIIAFLSGVEQPDRDVGAVEVGSPAWMNGIRPGDKLTQINGNRVDDFSDLVRHVVLSDGPVTVKGRHPDGTEFVVTLNPTPPDSERNRTRRTIGVAYPRSLRIPELPDAPGQPALQPGSPAALAKPGFEPNDLIVAVNDTPVTRFSELEALFARHRNETVTVTVERGEETSELKRVQIAIPPQPYRTLGLQMDIGKITAVRPGSPGERAGLKPGDKLALVDGRKIGDELDPLRVPELFDERIGEPVTIRYSREVAGSEPESRETTVIPEETPGWVENPSLPGSPVAVTSIGVAFRLIPTVFRVDPDGPAAKAGIRERDTITKLSFILRDDIPEAFQSDEPITVEIGEDNWAHAFWLLQQQPVERVRVTLKSTEGEQKREPLEIIPVEVDDWFVPGDRGLITEMKRSLLKADSVGEAIALGWRHTVDSTKDIYLTLRGLITSDISTKELQGPINIAKVAYQHAGLGLAPFLLFLGLISVNLAVINFLPIPVLDGGHMVFLIWEGVARRRPNERVVAAATYCGLFFVLGLMIFVIYQDLFGH